MRREKQLFAHLIKLFDFLGGHSYAKASEGREGAVVDADVIQRTANGRGANAPRPELSNLNITNINDREYF